MAILRVLCLRTTRYSFLYQAIKVFCRSFFKGRSMLIRVSQVLIVVIRIISAIMAADMVTGMLLLRRLVQAKSGPRSRIENCSDWALHARVACCEMKKRHSRPHFYGEENTSRPYTS